MTQMTLIQAVKQHLLLDGEQLSVNAYRSFTEQDKEDLKRDFKALDIEIIEKAA